MCARWDECGVAVRAGAARSDAAMKAELVNNAMRHRSVDEETFPFV